MSLCKVCGKPFRQQSNAQKYCKECGEYYIKEYNKRINRERLGNPEQDIEILRFIRNKKDKVHK